MGTRQAATTSTGAIVSDPQAVRELCESYCCGTLDWEVTEDGELTIWGFLRELADHLEADEELDIQTAGFTKCRFPVLAKRYVVRDGEVLHADLSSPDPIDE